MWEARRLLANAQGPNRFFQQLSLFEIAVTATYWQQYDLSRKEDKGRQWRVDGGG